MFAARMDVLVLLVLGIMLDAGVSAGMGMRSRACFVTKKACVSECYESKRRSKRTELNMVFDFLKEAQKASYIAAQNVMDANKAFNRGLEKSRDQLLGDVSALFDGFSNLGANASRDKLESMLEDLEAALLRADLGLQTTEDVISEVRSLVLEEGDDGKGSAIKIKSLSAVDLQSILRGKLIEALEFSAVTETQETQETQPLHDQEREDQDQQQQISRQNRRSAITFAQSEPGQDPKDQLTVLLMMGANGMGKTTTIGKLAHRLKTEAGLKVLLAACDTFRAGAVEQLELWADRAEVDCYSVPSGTSGTSKTARPSAVLYNALDQALSQNYDVLMVDTSGRLSNNDALTAELLKMKKVIQRRLSDHPDDTTSFNYNVPHETLLVVDAAQGRMALDSAKAWHSEVGLTGLILTKLDGSARGGSVVSISRELGLPVKLVGVGEGIDDLRDFDPETFVDGLLGIGEAGRAKTTTSRSTTPNFFGGMGIKASPPEGKDLALRLQQMRKERDERARVMKQRQPASKSPTATTTKPLEKASVAADEEADLITTAARMGQGKKRRNKNKAKKRKKGRR